MRKILMIVAACLAHAASAQAAEVKTVLAGGCFWSMEKALDGAPGVTRTISGYAGGDIEKPTYDTYHDGRHPHVEAVEVTYDDTKTSYAQLLDYYFRHIDPTSGNGQFCDFGPGYKPVIFTADDAQRKAAKEVKAKIAGELDKKVAVEIRDAGAFWPAEDQHQDYYIKNPAHYYSYRIRCGRDEKLTRIWGGNK